MGVYFDGVVSGTAAVDLVSPFHVFYVAADVTVEGALVGQLGRDVADHRSFVGWFSLGDQFDIGEGTFDRWRDQVWINFSHILWTPNPSTDNSGNPLSIFAPRMRYWFSLGTSVHLHVFGS